MRRVRRTALSLVLGALLLLVPFVGGSLAASDTTAPVLHSLSFPANPILFGDGHDERITLRVSDDSSGLVYINVTISGPGGATVEGSRSQSVGPPSYDVTVDLPFFRLGAPSGIWTLTQITIRDSAGNTATYEQSDLEAMGVPTTVEARRFSDVTLVDPYFTQIDDLAARGIIGGYTLGNFGPNDPVKRAQFAKMIVGTLGITLGSSTATRFTDLGLPDANGYPHKYVQAAYDHGITTGVTATTFKPYLNITRAQLITMVARAANLPEPPPDYSPGFGNFSSTHYQTARKAAYAGLLDGLPGMGPGYRFLDYATRGEVCVILYNLLHR